MTFVFNIGGSEWKSNYKVEYKKSKLFYYIMHDCEELFVQEIPLKPIKWKEFTTFIETECNWEKKYDNFENIKGKSWKLQFKNDRKTLFVIGKNSFPSNFDTFIQLLKELIGVNKDLD